MKDFYYILGVNEDCSLSDIKDAYRKLSKKFHPDLNQGDEYFENRFKAVQEAYDTLSDPLKRDLYNAKLNQNASGFANNQSFRQSYRAPSSSSRRYPYKKKGMGLGMSIVLILIVIILGVYLVKWLGTSKAPKVNSTAVVSNSHHHYKKHKKKSSLKNDAPVDSSHQNTDSKNAAAVLPKAISYKADTNTNHQPKKEFPYAAYVHANATGVINMRESDSYNSAIVETVPGNSKVSVLEKGDTYYKISFNDHIGYVPKWALRGK